MYLQLHSLMLLGTDGGSVSLADYCDLAQLPDTSTGPCVGVGVRAC